MIVQLRLVGGGYDDELEELSLSPYVPAVGQLIKGPDDFGLWRVKEVQLDYDEGFAREPTILVVAHPV